MMKILTWFPDGEMNTCYNCLDFHINGNGKIALIYDSPVTNQKKSFPTRSLQKLQK